MYALPANCYLPINHCNLPAQILGGLTFQQHPADLYIDGVIELHKELFSALKTKQAAQQRAELFIRYMRDLFGLDTLLDESSNYKRLKADYLCLLRGWMFDANNREGAVIKGWAESRFGLLPCWHKTAISSPLDNAYAYYMHERTTGIYNTNAIETQLDLLYSYCQYELHRRFTSSMHIELYRGINSISAYQVLDNENPQAPIVLLNNMNSLTDSEERAGEFGTLILAIKTPIQKIFYFSGLLPGILQGENEYITIGGLYRASIQRH